MIGDVYSFIVEVNGRGTVQLAEALLVPLAVEVLSHKRVSTPPEMRRASTSRLHGVVLTHPAIPAAHHDCKFVHECANKALTAFEQDLTFCYLHMTPQDLEVLDTLGTADYISGELSDTGQHSICPSRLYP